MSEVDLFSTVAPSGLSVPLGVEKWHCVAETGFELDRGLDRSEDFSERDKAQGVAGLVGVGMLGEQEEPGVPISKFLDENWDFLELPTILAHLHMRNWDSALR